MRIQAIWSYIGEGDKLATLIYGSHSRQKWLAGTFPASFAAARFRFQGFSL